MLPTLLNMAVEASARTSTPSGRAKGHASKPEPKVTAMAPRASGRLSTKSKDLPAKAVNTRAGRKTSKFSRLATAMSVGRLRAYR